MAALPRVPREPSLGRARQGLRYGSRPPFAPTLPGQTLVRRRRRRRPEDSSRRSYSSLVPQAKLTKAAPTRTVQRSVKTNQFLQRKCWGWVNSGRSGEARSNLHPVMAPPLAAVLDKHSNAGTSPPGTFVNSLLPPNTTPVN